MSGLVKMAVGRSVPGLGLGSVMPLVKIFLYFSTDTASSVSNRGGTVRTRRVLVLAASTVAT